MDNMLGRVEMGENTGKYFLENFAEKKLCSGSRFHRPSLRNLRQEYINSRHTTLTDALATNRAFEHEVAT